MSPRGSCRTCRATRSAPRPCASCSKPRIAPCAPASSGHKGGNAMPENVVDQHLSATADFFEGGLSPEAAFDFEQLLEQGQAPSLCRELREVPGGELLIVVRKAAVASREA